MSDTPGPGSAPGSQGSDEQFVVPVPTQALPVVEPTRELPLAAPPPLMPPSSGTWSTRPATPSTYAVQSVPWPPPTAAAPTERPVDPLLGQVGAALFWITVGWWLFFVVRLLGRIVRQGFDETLVIRSIDTGPEQTVTAAVLSLLAALLLLLGRGRTGRSPLGWASLVLALLTVVITVWRVLP